MERTVEPRRENERDGRTPSPVKLCLMLSLVVLVVGSAPAFALWLPWATEQDKIKKVVSDVWEGLTTNDQTLLSKSLFGVRVKGFIDDHQSQIKRLGIRSYQCLFKKISIDQTRGTSAQVLYETVATLGDGSVRASKIMSTVGKVGGEWKFLTDVDPLVDRLIKDKLKRDQEAAESADLYDPRSVTQPDFQRQTVTGAGGPR